MLKRVILILLGVASAVALLGSLTLWAACSVWLPTKGKAWLIREVERRAPVNLTVGSMRYHPLHGLILEDVRATDRATREIVGELPSLHVRIDWLALLARRDLRFHSRAVVTQPLQTRGTVSGRYHLRDHSLSLKAETADLPIPSIAAPVRRLVPPSLTDGILRLQLRLEQPAQSRPLIAGRVEGARLVWTTPSWTLRGDATIEGTVIPAADGAPFALEGDAALRHATLEAHPSTFLGGGSISDLNGTAKINAGRIEITSLTGTTLGSPWTLEGAVTIRPSPSFEVLLSSQANLASLAAAFPSLVRPWQPQGPAQVRAVCRGNLPPQPLDCLAQAEVRQATLAGPKLVSPLTEINGQARYDALTRELSIDWLTGRFMKESLTLKGAARLSDPAQLALRLTGVFPLDALGPWLPAAIAPKSLGGIAGLDLAISGSSREPVYDGRIELREAAAQWSAPALTIQQAAGSVRLSRDRVEISNATLTVNHEPLSLQAVLSLAQMPRLVATVGFRNGQLQLAGRLAPEEILLDQGQLALEKSHVEIRGRLARKADQASALDLSGTVELSELKDLPFFPLRALADWRLEGSSVIETQFLGRLSDWSAATVESRLRADRLRVRDIPLEQLTATLEQHGGVLRLRVPSGLCAEGKCWGELVIQRQPDQTRTFRIEADVVNLNLARLAQVIPSWRARSVTGAASARAMGFGTWEQRQSWRGEGWLNAMGERLGDVPLLDKLFSRLFGVLGDRLGLESLRRAQITHASLRWQLSKERFSTEDLRVGGLAGTEPIAIYAKGSVGLDRTLEIVIEPEFSEGVVLQAPTTSTLAMTVLKAAGRLERLRRLIGRHRITGTLEHPEYRFELTTQEIFKQLAPAPGDLFENLLDAVRPR